MVISRSKERCFKGLNSPGESEYHLLIRPEFSRFLGKIYFNHYLDHAVRLLCPPVQLLNQGMAVYRVYHIEEANGIFRLIRLEMADEVPRKRAFQFPRSFFAPPGYNSRPG